MKVHFAWGRAGAGAAGERGDVTVIIDCLRASSTIVVALASGMRAVVPTVSREPSRAPDTISAGERDGRRIPGFDHANSPIELRSRSYRGKTLWLSTTNGTPCIQEAAEGAAAVLIGCLLNAEAVARSVASIAGVERADVTLVGAGRKGAPAVEDALGAGEIARRIEDATLAYELEEPRDTDARALFLGSASGRRLLRLGYREDVELCARKDLYDLVPIYRAPEIVPLRPFRGIGT